MTATGSSRDAVTLTWWRPLAVKFAVGDDILPSDNILALVPIGCAVSCRSAVIHWWLFPVIAFVVWHPAVDRRKRVAEAACQLPLICCLHSAVICQSSHAHYRL